MYLNRVHEERVSMAVMLINTGYSHYTLGSHLGPFASQLARFHVITPASTPSPRPSIT